MIRKVRVRNFKSLRNVELTLGPLNVLVGSNMSGKSNILDVFRFICQVFFPESGTQNVAYALAQRGGVSEVLWKGGDEKLLSVSVEGVNEYDSNSEFEYQLELIAGIGDFVTVQKESLRLRKGGLERELIANLGTIVQYKNLDGKEIGSSPASGSSCMQYAPPNWDGRKFYDWMRLVRFYSLIPSAMREPTSMSMGQVLMPSGQNLSAWLMWLQTHSPEAFSRLNEVLHDLFPDILQVRTIPTPDGKVHLAATERGLKRPTSVWQASDGFLALTSLLSLIYVPANLSGTLFCIEEPENYLHPRILETLVELLRQVRQELTTTNRGVSQIILTTQSPYLLDRFLLDEIVWLEKEEGETKVYRPADKAHLKALIESKELGLGDLMFTGVLGTQS